MIGSLSVFQRPATMGWMVMAGTLPALGGASPRLPDRLLDNVDLSWPPLCFKVNDLLGDDLRFFLDDLELLVSVPPEVIDIQRASSDEILSATENAGLIVFVGGTTREWLRIMAPSQSYLNPAILLQEGRMMFAAGPAAGVIGTWAILGKEKELTTGLDWLKGAIILPHETAPLENLMVRKLLSKEEHSYAIGLLESAILSLGPDGQVEVWSEVSPVVSLGVGWGEA